MVPGAWWWPNSQIIEKFLFHFILFLGSDSGAGRNVLPGSAVTANFI